LQAKCTLDTLSNYETLIETASETGYISDSEIDTLKEWRKAPDRWKQ